MVRTFSSLPLFLIAVAVWGNEPKPDLASELAPLCQAFAQNEVGWTARIEARIDGKAQPIDASSYRYGPDAFDFKLSHPEYAVEIRRRAGVTAFALPKHGVVYIGEGATDPSDHLSPDDLFRRLASADSKVGAFLPLVGQTVDPQAVKLLLLGLLKANYSAERKQWRVGESVGFQISPETREVKLEIDSTHAELAIVSDTQEAPPADQWPELRRIDLDRGELERTLYRGVRRACEVLAPSAGLIHPAQKGKQVPHGELRWIEGQRVVLLSGSPEEIGQAHGELLKTEALRCIDSVLYGFGTVQTVRTGRWFRHDLDSAYARLAPHIPEDHKRETRSLAASLGIETQLAQTINVFPELFHCSGFAVFGKATKDGKLYHGRVLDYMTTIGLQDCAATFIVSVNGKIPFANVGYGGFIGSVSGMNAEGVSLGEMGGRGEGAWDGAPMATLMRRALEESHTLDDVINLWKNSPRTCEYYYVFADGKTNRAMGVAATPERIQFVGPGESHELLGEGIPDTVILSAGDRLTKLKERVRERYGQLDAESGQWLMCRPVAMASNLHNVLFVPQDGILYVANASHDQPAAERPYVRLDLRALMEQKNVSVVPHGAPTASKP